MLSRLHLLIPAALLVLWRPRLFGFQVGSTFKNWKLILLLLAINCAVIGGYLWLSGGTPYSGDQWLLTEVVTVPVVEETIWRGLVFAALYAALKKTRPDSSALRWTVILSGLAFGLLHAANILAGVPPAVRCAADPQRGCLGTGLWVCPRKDGQYLSAHASARGHEPAGCAFLIQSVLSDQCMNVGLVLY